jgi:hypothetical protein
MLMGVEGHDINAGWFHNKTITRMKSIFPALLALAEKIRVSK